MRNSNATIKYNKLRNLLKPHCKQIKPAGDLRRHCRDVERIELLAIPKVIELDPLFGNQVMPYPLIEDWVLKSELYFSINTPDHKRFDWDGCLVDLYLTNKYQWGVKMALLTGCQQFTNWLITQKENGGALGNEMCVKDDWLVIKQARIPTISEQHFFEAIEVDWIRPELRTEGIWSR